MLVFEFLLSFQGFNHPFEIFGAIDLDLLHENVVAVEFVLEDGLVTIFLFVLDCVSLEEVQVCHLNKLTIIYYYTQTLIIDIPNRTIIIINYLSKTISINM